MKPIVVALVLLLLATTAGADQRVDALFAAYDKSDSPGCVTAVSRGEEILHRNAYGMASIELQVPNAPDTVMQAGSIGKQFTAAAVLLLEQDGRLSLADPIRRYVPELPPYADEVTLEDLLHHTSGIRDSGELLWIAGGKDDDPESFDSVLELLARQRKLNFAPGTRFSYSGSGYILLAIAVQRITGTSLAAFARERIFTPLGMHDTHFREDAGSIIARRATGYRPQPGGGWRLGVYVSNTYGHGNLFTTVGDLLKWERNFSTASVGGAPLLERMQRPAKLVSGEPTGWAMGLLLWPNGDIGHEGRDFGYQASVTRNPATGLAIAVLCNGRDIDAWTLGRGITALFEPPATTTSADSAPAAPAPTPVAPASGTPTPATLARYAGTYWNPLTLAVRKVELRDGALVWARGDGTMLEPLGEARFRFAGQETEISFRERGKKVEGLDVMNPGGSTAYTRMEPFSTASIDQYSGAYHSDEVEASPVVTVKDGATLMFRYDADFAFGAQAVFADTFQIADGMLVQFQRDRRGHVTGFEVHTDRARGVWFAKTGGR